MTNRRGHLRAIAGIALVLMVSLGAGGPALAALVKTRIGAGVSPPSMDTIVIYVANEQGYFRAAGLDAEILAFRGGTTNAKALLAGEIDVSAEMGASTAIVSAAKGADMRAYYVLSGVPPYYLVARAPISRVTELAGRSIAVSGIGAISYHIPRAVLERAGVDPEKAKYVAIGSPADRFRAVVAGKVDATLAAPVEAVQLERYPQVRVLVKIPEVLPEFIYELTVAKKTTAQQKPEVVGGVVKGLIQGARFAARNKEAVVRIAHKITNVDEETLARSYDLFPKEHWSVNGELSRSQYEFSANLLTRVGYMKEPLPYAEFFDPRFVESALKELGRW